MGAARLRPLNRSSRSPPPPPRSAGRGCCCPALAAAGASGCAPAAGAAGMGAACGDSAACCREGRAGAGGGSGAPVGAACDKMRCVQNCSSCCSSSTWLRSGNVVCEEHNVRDGSPGGGTCEALPWLLLQHKQPHLRHTSFRSPGKAEPSTVACSRCTLRVVCRKAKKKQ